MEAGTEGSRHGRYAGSIVGGTESNLGGSRRILCLGVRSQEDDSRKATIGCSYLEVIHLVVAWESPHRSQNTHARETHAQHVMAETEVWEVGVGTVVSLGLLGRKR